MQNEVKGTPSCPNIYILDLNRNYWVLYTIFCCRKMYTRTWICGFGRNIICHIHIFINLALNEIFCAFFVSCNDIKMGCNMWLEEKLKPCFFSIPFHMLSHIYFYVTKVICIFLYTLSTIQSTRCDLQRDQAK